MKQLAFKLVLLAALSMAKPKLCGFNDKHFPKRQLLDLTQGRNLQTRDSSWESPRIQVVYQDMDVSASDKAYLQDDIIPAAVKWYENVLRVKPIKQALVFEGISECVQTSIPQSHQTEGVNADIVLYVTANDYETDAVGWAQPCVFETANSQPIAGQLNMVTTYREQLSYEDFLSTAIHEIAHILAFNPGLYEDFIDENGDKYSQDELFTQQTVRGKSTTFLSTPKVKKLAREHFDCSSLVGVELEDAGGQGSAGAHWDKRQMYADFMVADSDINDVVYSDITMGIFEDSGWYKVDYDYTNDLLWGYGEGCDFISDKCIENEQPKFNEFCVEKVDDRILRCDYKHLNKGYCRLDNYYSSVPSQFQYFSDSTLSGQNQFLDYCPVVSQATGGNCRGLENVASQGTAGLDEVFGLDSRCIEGDFVPNGYKQQHHASCHVVVCDGDEATIYIGDSVVKCNPGDGDKEVDGMVGVVNCPDTNILCLAMPCPNHCNGVGQCKSGVCHCDDGTEGGDCGDIKSGGTPRMSVDDNGAEGLMVAGVLFLVVM